MQMLSMVVMCQVGFMKYLILFPDTADFQPLVSCQAKTHYMSWGVGGVQPFRRES